jgi:hypothetical protein
MSEWGQLITIMLLSGDRRKALGLTGTLALIILLPGLLYGKAAKGKAPKPDKTRHVTDGENVFTNTELLRIRIEIPEPEMDTLRQYHWGGWGGGQEKRSAAKATVREGDKVYKDVAVHLKGAAGSFRPIDNNPSLTLNFDKNVKGQTFHGLERISLNNSVQDRSLLNEQIAREMFASAGVPVPRATHAKVELNGRDLGLYVLVEAFNKQFLARHFKNPNGNLYDGGFLKDVTDEIEKSSGPNPQDRSDLRRVADAAMEANLTNRLARLKKVLDVDQFISYLALDIMMCNWDGYAINRNNYRIYHDPDTDKIVFMPHGLDQMFGVMRVGTDMPIFPRWQGLVARALLQVPEARQRYRERISQLLTNVYQVEVLTNRVWQLAAKLRPALEEEGASAVQSHQNEVRLFCNRIADRATNIHQQLTAPDKTLKFDTAGVAHLNEWQSRGEYGKPILDETSESGKKLLHVSAANGSCVGLWATRVRLEPGHYRLEGRARAKGVVTDAGDRKGGAGVRMTKRAFKQKLTGDTAWVDIVFEFDVGDTPAQFGFMGPIQDEQAPVELICELRAAKGEAWFDRDSLRLVRQ